MGLVASKPRFVWIVWCPGGGGRGLNSAELWDKIMINRHQIPAQDPVISVSTIWFQKEYHINKSIRFITKYHWHHLNEVGQLSEKNHAIHVQSNKYDPMKFHFLCSECEWQNDWLVESTNNKNVRGKHILDSYSSPLCKKNNDGCLPFPILTGGWTKFLTA